MDAVPPDAVPPDAAALARELLPRVRRWDSASWAVPAVPPADPPGTGAAEAGLPAGPDPARPGAGGGAVEAGAGGAAPGGAGGGPTRAEVVAAAVQRLADAGADAEGRPRRTVPLLSDVNLGDQLAVMVEDILRTADPAALRAAAAELAALRSALGYR
jgi:hypothetical protein